MIICHVLQLTSMLIRLILRREDGFSYGLRPVWKLSTVLRSSLITCIGLQRRGFKADGLLRCLFTLLLKLIGFESLDLYLALRWSIEHLLEHVFSLLRSWLCNFTADIVYLLLALFYVKLFYLCKSFFTPAFMHGILLFADWSWTSIDWTLPMRWVDGRLSVSDSALHLSQWSVSSNLISLVYFYSLLRFSIGVTWRKRSHNLIPLTLMLPLIL